MIQLSTIKEVKIIGGSVMFFYMQLLNKDTLSTILSFNKPLLSFQNFFVPGCTNISTTVSGWRWVVA